jgi:hypothetical protein
LQNNRIKERLNYFHTLFFLFFFKEELKNKFGANGCASGSADASGYSSGGGGTISLPLPLYSSRHFVTFTLSY